MEMTKELLEQLKTAKSVEDLVSVAKTQGIELPLEAAKELFEKLSQANGELTDEMLGEVAGGYGVSASWVKSAARGSQEQGGKISF